MTDRYAGQTVAFLTQHGKESIVGPVLEPALGCTVVRAEGYDTDQLGTFTGDIRRLDSQLETARKKARIGMALSGARVGLASEGAFVSDPFGGLMPWNIEVLVWIDDHSQLEVVGMAQGPARSLHRTVRWLPELEKFAVEAGFPQHHLILRPQSDHDPRIHKGLSDWKTLKQAFTQCQGASDNQLVFAENDHRAFANPTRQSMIRQAALNLLEKLRSQCPQCATPGYAIREHTPGLPCRLCGHATRLAKSYTWHCSACDHRHQEAVPTRYAEPGRCDLCNP